MNIPLLSLDRTLSNHFAAIAISLTLMFSLALSLLIGFLNNVIYSYLSYIARMLRFLLTYTDLNLRHHHQVKKKKTKNLYSDPIMVQLR